MEEILQFSEAVVEVLHLGAQKHEVVHVPVRNDPELVVPEQLLAEALDLLEIARIESRRRPRLGRPARVGFHCLPRRAFSRGFFPTVNRRAQFPSFSLLRIFNARFN